MTSPERTGPPGAPPPLVNPYIVGNPIESRSLFFGREDDFAFIRNKITGGGTGGILVLCGTRRSGKTSILFQIRNGRLGDSHVPVLLDMQSLTVGRDADFLARLGQEIALALADPQLQAVADSLRSAADAEAYRKFRIFLDRLPAHLRGRRLVLLFDEYEIIETCIRDGKISKGILQLLAGWLEHDRGIFIIFTGSDKLEQRDPVYWQSFLGKALHRRVSFLSRNDTLRLIREPVAGEVVYEDGIPELIFELTDGQPFYTQVICQSLVDLLNEERRRTVSAADVDRVVAEIIENPLPHMIFAWSSLSALNRLLLSSLAAMAGQPGKLVDVAALEDHPRQDNLGFTLGANRVRESAEQLFRDDLLVKDESGNRYGFKMDLWRRWVRRMHSTWQVLGEIGDGADLAAQGITLVPSAARGGRRRRWSWAIALAAGLALVALWAAGRSRTPGAAPATGRHADSSAAPDSGWISITSTPAGAMVTLDGRVLGMADGNRLRAPAGRASLRLTLDRHRAWQGVVTVVADSQVTRSIDLSRATGHLRVESNPSGAEVWLDGKATGRRTPALMADLPVREGYRVDLRGAGLESWSSAPFAVPADDTIAIFGELAAARFALSITTSPAASEIIWAGRPLGPSPARLDGLTGGTYRMEARLAGYDTLRTAVTVPAPGSLATFALQPRAPGRLVIKVLNTYAEIWVDELRVAQQAANHEMDLPPGRHQIELRNPAFATYRTEVLVRAGQTSICEHLFRKGEDAR